MNVETLRQVPLFESLDTEAAHELCELLESLGPFKVREPYVKPLGGKLFEMRMKGSSGIGRAIYIAASGQRLVVLHVFIKKSNKTPQGAIRIAMQRAREVT
jgi:phage-related protein